MHVPVTQSIGLIVALGLAVRCALMTQPHSGQGRPPLHGDMEAQRHWMEITLHTPLHEWYVETPRNDLQYWGLDYPPLTAYVSWACGRAGTVMHPSTVAWWTSRGAEGQGDKAFLRGSVLLCELLSYFPAVLALIALLRRAGRKLEPCVFALMLSPSLLLIDHAHFQYNSVLLGLVLFSAVAGAGEQYMAAAGMFAAALNFKQMALYYAPSMFVFLLAVCWRNGWEGVIRKEPSVMRTKLCSRILAVCFVGIPVIFVFTALWLPFCLAGVMNGGTCISSVMHVLGRVFPVNRGLFEDKVANIWCSLEPILHFRRLLLGQNIGTAHKLVLGVCTVTTCVLMAPSLVGFWKYMQSRTQPNVHTTLRVLLLAMFTTSLSFFLASYQVHEKGILLPAMPIAALAGEFPIISYIFALTAAWSMWPLYALDKTLPAAAALVLSYAVLAYPWQSNKDDFSVIGAWSSWGANLLPEEELIGRVVRIGPDGARWLAKAIVGSVQVLFLVLSGVALLVTPPSELPDLHAYLAAVTSACIFFGSLGVGTALMFVEGENCTTTNDKEE